MQRVIPKLLTWYRENYRQLPWRETQNPYYIWVSEIILQQTRVDQGLSYYLRFIDKFPQIHDLANAEETDILKIWQGLGYYARARNMQKAAKIVLSDFDGEFPKKYTEILQLPGVGNYTAAAVASFSFKTPVAAIDGNVKRVMSRFLGIQTPIDKSIFLQVTQDFLNEQIPKNEPDVFNQSMIELGALVCTPTHPKCEICPLREECFAARENKQAHFPVVAKKQKATHWEINYALFQEHDSILMVKRASSGIWGGLHEFPQLKKDHPSKGEKIAVFEHKLSHKNIVAALYKAKDFSDLEPIDGEQIWIKIENVNFFPMHKLMLKFVEHLGWE